MQDSRFRSLTRDCARYRTPQDNHDFQIRVTTCPIIRRLRVQEGEEGREGTPSLDSRTLAIAATILRVHRRHRCHDIVPETVKDLPSRGSCFADRIKVYSRVFVFSWASTSQRPDLTPNHVIVLSFLPFLVIRFVSFLPKRHQKHAQHTPHPSTAPPHWVHLIT